MKAKLIRLHMDRVGPTPEGAELEYIKDPALIQGLLIAKLHEEAQEIADAPTKTQFLEEMGDLYEVLHTLAVLNGTQMETIRHIAEAKADLRGPLLTSDKFGGVTGLVLKRGAYP